MDITQYQLAKAVGVDTGRMQAIIQGAQPITAETALLSALRQSSEWDCRTNTSWRSPETVFLPAGYDIKVLASFMKEVR